MKSTIDETRLLDVSHYQEWRDWLEEHYLSEREAWLVFHKKHTGKPSLSYNEAVEEALCFGWIDSTVKRIDEDRYAQKFSKRNPKSFYSQANKERLRFLAKQGKVIDEVMATLGNILEEQFEVPADILEAIKADEKAWENYQKFSPAYIRIRIAFIEGARDRPEEFEKRLRYFITMTAKDKQFGFGSIEKYY
jgi:uncharacterized protein YdeI (YjbR/CyaY-like superfamily)